MIIEKAHATDAKAITELTLRSKAYWNYGETQIEAWKEELTIHPSYIQDNHVFKLEDQGQLIGFYAYLFLEKSRVKLTFLFIDPPFIGKGYGNVLIQDFFERIMPDKVERVVLDADPNAEQFYQRHGFKVIGKLASSIKDRYLPIMEKNLRL